MHVSINMCSYKNLFIAKMFCESSKYRLENTDSDIVLVRYYRLRVIIINAAIIISPILQFDS